MLPKEEVDLKFNLKVGDRPKWTKEMIQALPHGTCLSGIFKEVFFYNGEPLQFDIADDSNDIYIESQEESFFFTHFQHKVYAEIISLPTEIVSEPVKEDANQLVDCKCKNLNEVENCVRNCGHDSEPVIQDEEIKNNPLLKEFVVWLFEEHDKSVNESLISDFIKSRTKRPSLVEAERIAKEFMQSDLSTHTIEPKLTELIEKLILKKKE